MSVIRDVLEFEVIDTNPGIAILRSCPACCAYTEDNGWSTTAEADYS